MERTTRNGITTQAEITIEWGADWLTPPAEDLLATLEENVRRGARYNAGESFAIGCSTLSFAKKEDGSLSLPGVDHAFRTLSHQRFVAESFGFAERMAVPRSTDRAVVCSDLGRGMPRFMLVRSQPAFDGDSGWFASCGDMDHDHDDADELSTISIAEVISKKAALAEFLALPASTAILFDMGKFGLMHDGEDVKPARDSYFARKLARTDAPTFDDDILALITEHRLSEASRLACERYTMIYGIASQWVLAVHAKAPNKPTDELITSFARANRIIDAQMLHRELHGSSVMQSVRAVEAIAKAS
jgi:hypothetical protein